MARRKESFFWTSYSDLMTSLFFVMLVLFVLVIVLLHSRVVATEKELTAIKQVERSTEGLKKKGGYFIFNEEHQKYVLNFPVQFNVGDADFNNIDRVTKEKLKEAGRQIEEFLLRNHEHQYVMIIEGQASADGYPDNYGLSYKRAIGLMAYWTRTCHLRFGQNCEIQISGSGDGLLPTNSWREKDQRRNQRFLIHILPKNIIDK